MSRLDDELRMALQRREVSPDFTAKVMARIAELPPVPVSPWQKLVAFFRLPAVQFSTAGALVCLLIGLTFGVRYYREYREMKREGEIARAQVMLAFQIASSKLNKAKQKVNQAAERIATDDEPPPAGLQHETKTKHHGER
ncbi:MAG: hypothetical protein U0Z53_27030 [Blastocatellia bacterium]